MLKYIQVCLFQETILLFFAKMFICFWFFYFPRTLDPSIAEAVSSLLWVAPQLFTDVAEMKVISEQLTVKYGKKYTEVCY